MESRFDGNTLLHKLYVIYSLKSEQPHILFFSVYTDPEWVISFIATCSYSVGPGCLHGFHMIIERCLMICYSQHEW